MRYLDPRRQRILHALGILICGVLLARHLSIEPIADTTQPIRSVAMFVMATVGLPFFLLSATSPILQRWVDVPNPYPLFAASNAGSLIALLAYPLLFERALDLDQQSNLWRGGLAIWSVAMVALAFVPARPQATMHAAPTASPTTATVARWIVFAAIPSGLMLAVTETITTDVAPVPLLWIIPLAIYLATFIIPFAPGQPPTAQRLIPIVPIAMIPAIPIMVFSVTSPVWLVGGYHLALLAIVGLVYHGALSRQRPSAHHLTMFYLAIAAGGVLGGALVSFVAPAVTTRLLEHPLLIGAAGLALPAAVATKRSYSDAIIAAAIAAGVISQTETQLALRNVTISYAAFALIVVPFVLSPRRPRAFSAGAAALLLGGVVVGTFARPTLFEGRSFFATYEVVEDKHTGTRFLLHGTTIHGAQSNAHPQMALPYYPSGSPVDEILSRTSSTAHIAVMGLGAGALATYVRPGQTFSFYEIDAQIVRIARDPTLFTFVENCKGTCKTEVGDARLLLTAEPDGEFEVVVQNAFTSHAVPVHLITAEALDAMFRKLAPGGIAIFNITNRYVDLAPVIGAYARDRHVQARVRAHEPTAQQRADAFVTESRWLVLARAESDLARYLSHPDWTPVAPSGHRMWTDRFASPLAIYNWR